MTPPASFRTCPVCGRLTLNVRCDHPNCPSTATQPEGDPMTATDRDPEPCTDLCPCGADAHPVVSATYLGLEPIA